MVNKLISDELADLDKPIESGFVSNYFKKGKIQCRIIFEDGSYSDSYQKLKLDYRVKIANKTYMLTPECIVAGKSPFVCWYYNNPMPIYFGYQRSKFTAKDMITPKEYANLPPEKQKILANTILDGSGLSAVFNTNLLQGLYSSNDFWTVKNILIIGVVGTIILLVVLQLTGTVDIIGQLNSVVKGS